MAAWHDRVCSRLKGTDKVHNVTSRNCLSPDARKGGVRDGCHVGSWGARGENVHVPDEWVVVCLSVCLSVISVDKNGGQAGFG